MSSPATAVTDPDTGSRYYTYPPTGEPFRSVTTYIDDTSAKPWLVPWSSKIAAAFAVDNLARVAREKRTAGRDAAIGLVKSEAERIRGTKRDTGGYVHDVVEALLYWQASPEGHGAELMLPVLAERLAGEDYDGEPVESVARWMLDGFVNFAAAWKPVFEATEMTVYNPSLKVAGTLDMIVFLPGVAPGPTGRFIAGPGVRCCIDVKTGRNLDAAAWHEQVAAYRRMQVARMPLGELVAMPATGCGAVLHLRPEHEDGYQLMPVSARDDALGWNRFRRAMELSDGRAATRKKPGKVSRPPRADGTIPQPRLRDLAGEGYGQAPGLLAKAGIGDLEQLAAMTAGQLVKIRGIGGKTVDVARAMLADHGLHLAGEAPRATGEAA
jgi:hypothetical protein